MLRTAVAAALAAGVLAPFGVQAQKVEPLTYRCVGKDKKTYYGQTPPPQCAGMPLEMLNRQGLVVRRVDPQADAANKAAKEAEDAKKREDDAAQRDRQRRDRALLATYTSEADVEAARKRALLDNEKAIQTIDMRTASIRKRQAELTKELEFYKGKNKPPAKLEQEIKGAESELRAQEEQRAKRQKDIEAINARYDEDLRRYVELTRGAAAKK
jgi:hypothetical protein